jgi:hypothetical protein
MDKNFRSRLLAIAVMVAACVTAMAADRAAVGPIGKTALVLTVTETNGGPCGHPIVPAPAHVYWGLRPGKSKFKLEKKAGVVFKITRVMPVTEDPEMEEPEFYVFNDNGSPMTADVCTSNDSLKKFPFAFAIHDLKDPHSPGQKWPHALIFVPMDLKDGPHFSLLVFSIKKSAAECVLPSGAIDAQCAAFRHLADIQGSVSETDFITAIWDAIDVIDPKHPSPAKFHNGVIHGSL